ncbi:MAG: hypothetical protein JNK85_15020 [Verrucomicrobiales bacterium]|nr:hypothetical protein [Verrucomicrobiales bacterium]
MRTAHDDSGNDRSETRLATMPGDFSPLSAKRHLGGDDATFRVKVIPAPAAGSFVPHPVPATAAGGLSGEGHAEGPPTITVRKEGDRVAGIRIQCSCGQVIDLACTYS